MYTREFVHSGQKTCFTITRAQAGWDVREVRDNAVVRQAHYSDWHRVERAIQLFEKLQAPETRQS